MSNGKVTADVSGNVHVDGVLDVSGGIKVNYPIFFVRPDGVLLINGQTIDQKFAISVVTSQDISGTLRVALLSSLNGGIDVSGGKFTVAASTGSTHIEGVLDVSGRSVLNGGLDVSGGYSNLNGGIKVNDPSFVVTPAGVLLIDGLTLDQKYGSSVVTNQDISGTLRVAQLSSLNGGIDVSSGKFTVAASTGSTHIEGVLDVSGLTRLNAGLNMSNGKVTVGTNGNVHIDGVLDVSDLTRLNSGLDISNGKVVADVSGNVHVGGVLDVSGQTRLNGDVYIANKSLDISNSTVNIRNLNGISVFTYNNAADEINIESLTGTNLTFPTSNSNSQLKITGSGVLINGAKLGGTTTCDDGYLKLSNNTISSQTLWNNGGLLQVGTYANPSGTPTQDNLLASINGDAVVTGDLVVKGTLTSGGTVVSAPVWADISSAINTELGTIGILDISESIGATSGEGLPTTAPSNTASGTVNGFAGRYLTSSATSTEVITTLNAVIATQNRIINALRFNKLNGLP
jgi:hypothetical protein